MASACMSSFCPGQHGRGSGAEQTDHVDRLDLGLELAVLFVLWILAWGLSGYYAQRRIRGIVVGVVSAAIAPTVGFFISLAGILMGPVQTFEVMRRVEGPWVAAVSSPVALGSRVDQIEDPDEKGASDRRPGLHRKPSR